MALKALDGDAKRYCQKGHDLEKTYTSHLMLDSLNNNFPFGKIEQTSEVGLVQKIDKPYVKDSIDRIIGFLPTASSQPSLLLYEIKARVAPTTAQQERERVLQYHNGEKYISTHSSSPNS